MGISHFSVTFSCDHGSNTEWPCQAELRVHERSSIDAILAAERAGWEILDIPEPAAYCPKHNCYRLD